MKVIRSKDFRSWLKGFIKGCEEEAQNTSNKKLKYADKKRTRTLRYIESRIEDFEVEIKNV